jgi:hypothetical protein
MLDTVANDESPRKINRVSAKQLRQRVALSEAQEHYLNENSETVHLLWEKFV